MTSLVTKLNKGRSPVSKRATTKKVASKKIKKKIAAAPKKGAVKKAEKQAPLKKLSAAKGASAKKGAKAAKKPARRAEAKKVVATKAVAKTSAPAKPIQQQSPLAPQTFAALRAFEQALKVFNRQDFAAAKVAFENFLERFGNQAEIAARARTYLAICDKRLARAPSIPRNPDALYNRGVFELNKGNLREAVELFEKALKAEPRADHVLYSLAAAYARIGNASRALDTLQRAISLQPVHRPHARRDPDFASLRTNPRFQKLVGLEFDFLE
jgi:tetratricopeptide (TPR) repeat protein